MCYGVTIYSYIFTRTRIRYRKHVLHRYIVTPRKSEKYQTTKYLKTMNKSQIRFAMAAHTAWLVMKNPVLTRVYMKQWESMYPRPMSVDGEELTLYGYVFNIMYKEV